MPNWCWTNYVIEGEEKEIADLYQKMESLEQMETSLVENGFGKTWLGNLVTLFGGDWKTIYCRGYFMNLERKDATSFSFDTETAWSNKSEVWNFICGKYKSLQYYFAAEESGCCYYATNDKDGKYFPEKFLVEQWNEESGYYESESGLFKDISMRTGMEVNDKEEMGKAIETYNAVNPENKVYVHEFELVN